jgi:hypothetical protein
MEPEGSLPSSQELSTCTKEKNKKIKIGRNLTSTSTSRATPVQ